MLLTPGTRLGHYEIVGTLGAGGMGEVYRARDTSLGRDVAIKVLSPALTGDPEGLVRFEREARVLAALNHPNIGAIYGVERPSTTGELKPSALVLEFVEGDTLADRLARGGRTGLPVADVVAIARQVADALDAAHEKGIVHRDLKPSNLKITPEGLVKVLDFGIAKVVDHSAAGPAESPTMTGETRQGVSIGTPAYMSPEQTRGKPVDKRTDIWAFGCLLFEMLTGKPAFAGATISDTIAATLEREPDWSLIPRSTPKSLLHLLRRCLAKDPKDRLRDIGDARVELRQDREEAFAEARSTTFRSTGSKLAIGLLVALILLGGALAGRWSAQRSRIGTSPAVVQFWVAPPAGSEFSRDPNFTFLALSPDGSKLAFVARERSGQSRIWLRPLSELVPQPVQGTGGALSAFWSPDGRSLGFFVSGMLKRLDLDRNAVVPICDTPSGGNFSGTWGADRILFAPVSSDAIYSVAIGGGTPTVEIKAPTTAASGSRGFCPTAGASCWCLANQAASAG